MQIYYFMIIGLCVIGFYLCEIKKSQKSKLCFLLISGLVLTVIGSLRYAIGFDYFSYRNIYNNMKEIPWNQLISIYKEEFLFYAVNKIVSLLGCSYEGYLLIINIFLNATLIWFIKRYSKIPWLSIYLFITLQFLAHNMNLLRQSIGVCFFLLAYPFLQNKKWFKYCVIMIIGGLFHNSVFLILILSFGFYLKNTWTNIFGLAVAFTIFYLLLDPITEYVLTHFVKIYKNYIHSYYWQANSWSYTILPILYLIFILCMKKKLIKKNEKNKILVNSAIIFCMFSILITKHFILERFAVYPFILSIILFPELVVIDREEREQKNNTVSLSFVLKNRILILTLLFGGIYFSFAVLEGFHNVYPYYSLFDRAIR